MRPALKPWNAAATSKVREFVHKTIYLVLLPRLDSTLAQTISLILFHLKMLFYQLTELL